MSSNMPAVRFAPSPTGFFHIGSARTALFNYLFAQKNNARNVLRFEDTDASRSQPEFEQDIQEGLEWLGIAYDETYYQSKRTEVYSAHIAQLIESDVAYLSEETEGERGEVVRFRNPGGEIIFHDEIRGDVTFDVAELGDFVIARSQTEPLYHLAVVIDDMDAGVTHVIRGEDHISNTPRQILILEALGGTRPTYAHIPMILAPDRSKMSKRHGAVSISEYRDQGFLPEALINYLALLGWNPGTDEEVFTMHELVERFRIDQINKSGAIFSLEKLRWFNEEHLKKRSFEMKRAELQEYLDTHQNTDERVSQVVHLMNENKTFAALVLERISVYGDMVELCREGEYDFLFERPQIETTALHWKNTPSETTLRHLRHAREALSGVNEYTADDVKNALWDYASEEGRGEVLWPLRYTLSGRERSADPFTLCAILGKEETLARIDAVIMQLES